jgi:hypothetical protein
MFRHVLLVLVAFLYCNTVNASLLTPITDPGTGAKVYVPSASGLGQKSTFTSNVNIGSGTAKVPTTLVKNFGWGRVGTAVRTIAKGSPQALVGSVALAWLIEQIPGGEVSDGSPVRVVDGEPMPLGSGSYYWEVQASPYTRGNGPESACKAYLSTKSGTYAVKSMTQSTEKAWTCRWGSPSTTNTDINTPVVLKGSSCATGATFEPSTGYCRGTTVVPFSDADYDQLAAKVPSIPYDYWNDFGPALDAIPGTFDGPDTVDFTGPPSVDLPSTTTTTTNPATGDVTVTDVLPSVQFEYGSSPLSVTATPTTTTNTYQNGAKTSTSTTTTNNTQNSNVTITPASTEVPTDCAFMPTVCQFIEWVKTPFEPEDVDFEQFTEDKDFNESITITGNATCPAPMILGTSKGDFEFSWEPACQWAGMLKPILIIGALIAAIYISLGIGRSD